MVCLPEMVDLCVEDIEEARCRLECVNQLPLLSCNFTAPLLESRLPGLSLSLVAWNASESFFKLLELLFSQLVSFGERSQKHDGPVEVFKMLGKTRG